MIEEQLYKERLIILLDLLEKANLKPFLLCGTLFSAWRDGQPFSQDYKDIDIALREEDYWKFREIIDNSEDFTYYRVWRGEIAVLYKLCAKIDVFFLENRPDNTYIYSYKKNPFVGKWETEWRSIFNSEDFYPLQRWHYKWLGRDVYIPKNVENILSAHYGNWQVPEPDWTIDRMTNVDNLYREITFLINKSNQDKYNKCVTSINHVYPNDWFEVSNLTDIDLIESPYIVLAHDIIKFTKETKLQDAIQVLLHKPDIIAVGQFLSNPSVKWEKTFSGRTQPYLNYCIADIDQRCIVAKKEFFSNKGNGKIAAINSLNFKVGE